MTGVEQRVVGDDEGGMRLDRWFRVHFPGLANAHLNKLIRKGQVRVDGARAKPNDRLETGQTIRVPPMRLNAGPQGDKPRAARIRPEDRRMIAERTLYEDAHLVVLDKPAGLAVQGGTGTRHHLDGMLMALEAETGKRWRLVHRLDRDTSGVIVIAKTRDVSARLGKAFQSRSVQKTYWCLTCGVPKPPQGTIDLPLIKSAGPEGERMRAARQDEPGADKAITRFNVLDRVGDRFAWVTAKPVTGRQHQIRAHLAAIGTPIAGDDKYSGDAGLPATLPRKLHLHARRVRFDHPIERGGTVDVTAPLPPHMTESFGFLGLSVEERHGGGDD